jgi:hypothetical protein
MPCWKGFFSFGFSFDNEIKFRLGDANIFQQEVPNPPPPSQMKYMDGKEGKTSKNQAHGWMEGGKNPKKSSTWMDG